MVVKLARPCYEGALAPWNPISSNYYPQMLEQAMAAFGIDMDKLL